MGRMAAVRTELVIIIAGPVEVTLQRSRPPSSSSVTLSAGGNNSGSIVTSRADGCCNSGSDTCPSLLLQYRLVASMREYRFEAPSACLTATRISHTSFLCCSFAFGRLL